MPSRHLTRLTLALASSALLTGVLAGPPAEADPVAAPALRADTNPTGTASGSSPNGVGGLKLSLTSLSDGRIKVTWKRPGPASRLKRYVLQVGPTRKLDRDVKTYRIKRKKQSAIVVRAVDAGTTSGNYSFVKITAIRKNRTKGASPTKWIQAPIAYACTAAAKDRVRVGTFNVRTWSADAPSSGFGWNVRGDNVVGEILRSGAHVVALQEASGAPNKGFASPKFQRQWIVDRLNDLDPDAAATWVDGVADEAYKPKPGGKGGLQGTRVIFDSSKYVKLDSGLERITDPKAASDSLVPWVRLQAPGQAPFVMTSNHLRVGEGRTEFDIRGRQVVRLIGILKGLRAKFPTDQVVMAGDLNSTANSKPFNNVQRALLNAGLFDAYATRTLVGAKFPTSNMYKFPLAPTPHRRDYIMTLGGAKGSCGYMNQTYPSKSQVASDHFMQNATLPLPPA